MEGRARGQSGSARSAEAKAGRLAQRRLEHDKIDEAPKGLIEEIKTVKKKRNNQRKGQTRRLDLPGDQTASTSAKQVTGTLDGQEQGLGTAEFNASLDDCSDLEHSQGVGTAWAASEGRVARVAEACPQPRRRGAGRRPRRVQSIPCCPCWPS